MQEAPQVVETSVGTWWEGFSGKEASCSNATENINETRGSSIWGSAAQSIDRVPGGAMAQCRFRGRTAKPIFCSPPLDSSVRLRTDEGCSDPNKEGQKNQKLSVASKRAYIWDKADTNSALLHGKGRRCDEELDDDEDDKTVCFLATEAGEASKWRFNLERWQWERTYGSKALKFSQKGRYEDIFTSEDRFVHPNKRKSVGESSLDVTSDTSMNQSQVLCSIEYDGCITTGLREEIDSPIEGSTLKDHVQSSSDCSSKKYKKNPGMGSQYGFQGVGGFHLQKEELLCSVVYPLKFSKLYDHIFNWKSSSYHETGVVGNMGPNSSCVNSYHSGVLLHGPPGSGKTYLACAAAREYAGCSFEFVDCASCIGNERAENRLREAFDRAKRCAPSIILLDEVDVLAPNRSHSNVSDVERQSTALLLVLIDNLRKTNANVSLVATSSHVDAIDPAMRRPGRLDKEISIGLPSVRDRFEILSIASSAMPIAMDVDIREISNNLHGFMAADIAAVVTNAAMMCVSESIATAEAEGKLPALLAADSDTLREKIQVNRSHFQNAISQLSPSVLRSIVTVQAPRNISWNDIGGLEVVKSEIREAIEWPVLYGDYLVSAGFDPEVFATGILLYGPPGCGKTMLAKAVAGSCGCNFVAVNGPELMQKWVGESERAIRDIFKTARSASPCVLFFDEIDAIANSRSMNELGFEVAGQAASSRVLTQLLVEMDGVAASRRVTDYRGNRSCDKGKNENDGNDHCSFPSYGGDHIIVMAATNRPAAIDPALLRPGRLTRLIKVPLPDAKARCSILQSTLKKCPMESDVDLESIAKSNYMEGMSGADVAEVGRRAGSTIVNSWILNSKRIEVDSANGDSSRTLNESQGHEKANLSSLLTQKIILDAAKSVRKSVTDEQNKYFDELERRIQAGETLTESTQNTDSLTLKAEMVEKLIQVACEKQSSVLHSRIKQLENYIIESGLNVPSETSERH